MGITNSKTQYIALGILTAIVILFGVFFYFLNDAATLGLSRQIFRGLTLILFSTGLTVLILFGITCIFGYTNFKLGFLNFLIGDNGTYSLSRLQAVLWAVVILSYQISIILCLCFNKNGNLFHIYQPVLSETAIWLLGLSLTSSIAIKGITLTNTQASTITPRTKTVPRLGDILVGDNGLDFSKCQMLIWTLLAVIVFESKCYYFTKELLVQKEPQVTLILDNFYDEYSPSKATANKDTAPLPFVPYLPWSFVVLMGLSQGAYIGKKLVPSFKVGDLKVSKEQELVFQNEQLMKKTEILNKILKNTAIGEGSAIDKISEQHIKNDIALTREKIDALQGDINQINNYTRQ